MNKLCLTLAALCACTDAGEPDALEGTTSAEIHGGAETCNDCGAIGFTVTGDPTMRTAQVVAPRLLLTSKTWLPTTVGPADLTLSNWSAMAVEIIRHPSRDAALIRVNTTWTGTIPTLASSAPSLGTSMRCKGFQGANNFQGAPISVYSVSGDHFYGSNHPACSFHLDDGIRDRGDPCLTTVTWPVSGTVLWGIVYSAWWKHPGCTTDAEVLSVASIREWILDQAHLASVKLTRSPVSIYFVEPDGTRKCMDVANASIANQAAVNKFPCHGGLNQHWYLAASGVAGGYNTFVSGMSGKCLDVPNSSTTAGLGLQQYTCFGAANQAQAWYPSFYNPGIRWTVRSSSPVIANQLCMTATAGGRITQDVCTGAAGQRWYQWANPSPANHP